MYLESPTSSFQVQSNDLKCFQAAEKLSPLFSTTLKNYSRLIIPPKILKQRLNWLTRSDTIRTRDLIYLASCLVIRFTLFITSAPVFFVYAVWFSLWYTISYVFMYLDQLNWLISEKLINLSQCDFPFQLEEQTASVLFYFVLSLRFLHIYNVAMSLVAYLYIYLS